MEPAGPRSTAGVAPATRWALAAGAYAFLWSTVLLWRMGAVTDALGQLLPYTTGPPAVFLALPVPSVGAIAWWAVVERRGAYSYPRGAAAGAVTALGATLCWLVVYAFVWGPRLVATGGILIAVVLVVTVPTAALVMLPLLYVRRQRSAEPAAASTAS